MTSASAAGVWVERPHVILVLPELGVGIDSFAVPERVKAGLRVPSSGHAEYQGLGAWIHMCLLRIEGRWFSGLELKGMEAEGTVRTECSLLPKCRWTWLRGGDSS